MLGRGQKSLTGYDRVDKQDKTIQNSTGYIKPVSKCIVTRLGNTFQSG